MHFKKLRLHGFKSFVDQTELLIEPGITGVVGPNGCGKSNVIESLRWVMGETSAKRMRGGEMDDVIFGGSSSRPARNVAEVAVTLENTDRTAPAAFNDSDEVEISRRIERGAGSNYRVNGKDVRARDVQLLFADLASGANSTAIVSQGRVGALIGAKPTERRTLLEEAAGIRGLHSRRHEAELRLRAAETNLERLEDVIQALESQYSGLQRQSRQAQRYRKISENLRQQEAILLHIRWTKAMKAREEAQARLKSADEDVAERTKEAAAASTAQAEASEGLPARRQAEAEAGARLQNEKIAESRISEEESRITEQLRTLDATLTQIEGDRNREGTLAEDAAEALSRLEEEKAAIERRVRDEESHAKSARTERDEADRQVNEKEAALQELTEHVAAVDAQRSAFERQLREAEAGIEKYEARLTALLDERAALESEVAAAGDIEALHDAVADAEKALADAQQATDMAEEQLVDREAAAESLRHPVLEAESEHRARLDALREEGRTRLETVEREAREAVQAAQAELQRLESEEAALAALVEAEEEENDYPPTIDSLDVTVGFETALGAALGEDLDAALEEDAARHWTELPSLTEVPPLPGAATPLKEIVSAPKALSRRLSQIGVVADATEAESLWPDLKQGQRLVSKDGGLWRWDGFTIRPGTQTAAARRLEQKNRLAELREKLEPARMALTKAREEADERIDVVKTVEATRFEEAEQAGARSLEDIQSRRDAAERAYVEAGEAARECRAAQQTAYAEAAEARRALESLNTSVSAARNRIAAIDDETARLEEELKESRGRITAIRDGMSVLEDPTAARERVARQRASLAELRARQVEKRSAYDRLRQEAEARAQRMNSIAIEEKSWRNRAESAAARNEDLERRREAAIQEKLALEARPAELQERRAVILKAIGELESARQEAADRLAKAEGDLRDADQALRAAEQALAQSREIRVRREAEVEQADQTLEGISDRIHEKLECRPSQALELAGMTQDDTLPDEQDVERRLERLSRERDNIGPVNLRAEQEAEDLSEQIASMHAERDDLLAAIDRLRKGINALNREGRERLLAAFEQVDGHFQDLFVRLFGGGEAHLKLTEADDPLQAGLEIMASPPGKKMQILSLLSGGEQALTALALLFAVFLTNPAPICVLDEVDAPLDDSNVDRFCTLLDEIAHSGTTRFLVVTHHRMTMARVDRLFGVTMGERGVSQLVSVDLGEAVRLRDAG